MGEAPRDFRQQPPPFPPPPVINYAAPMPPPVQPGVRNFGQKAARASWICALAVFVFAACGNLSSAGNHDPMVMALFGVIDFGLLIFGLTAGVIALFRVRAYGREGVLVPAIVGVSINMLIFGLMAIGAVAAILAAGSPRRAAPVPPAAAAPTMTTAQIQDEALFAHDGWVGEYDAPNFRVVAMDVGRGTHMDIDFQDEMPARSAEILFAVTNISEGEPVVADLRKVKYTLRDGTAQTGLSERDIQRNLDSMPQLVQSSDGKITINPRQEPPDAFVFLPRDVDMTKLASITVEINGEDVVVPGEIWTSQKKKKAQKANAAATQKSE